MLRLCFTLLLMLMPFPLHAQDQTALELARDPEYILPEHGPYDRLQSEVLVLREYGGEILSRETYLELDDVFHEFETMLHDGTVLKIDVYGDIGEIRQVKVKQLGKNGKLPPPGIEEEDAKEAAIDYVMKKTTGRSAKIDEIEYMLEDGFMVYRVLVKKRSTDYEVIINARTGKVYRARRIY